MLDMIKDARESIREYIYETPLVEAQYIESEGRNYFFKLECLQKTRSFKLRGALYRMLKLSEEEKERGVATISSGNHGAAVSYAASLLGIEKKIIIVPEITPNAKIDKIKKAGGEALLMGNCYDEAHAQGMEYIENEGMTYIDPYDIDPVVYAGQGTIGLEILEQNPDIDTIAVPVGGGGISSGIAAAVKGIRKDMRVIGVQTEACPAMIRSMEDNICYTEYPIKGKSICESLTGGIGRLAFEMHKELIDGYVEVSEDEVRKAAAHMAGMKKYIAEGGSSTVIAAAMFHPEELGGKNVALVVTGGNIEKELLAEILNE